ncbi:unnamed protein product [Closterium sp. Naga37s-1]|nr:unnamed protein product [Closterium sp. Naga37s-1]
MDESEADEDSRKLVVAKETHHTDGAKPNQEDSEKQEKQEEKNLPGDSSEESDSEAVRKVHFWELFKFADGWDVLLMLCGSTAAIGLGVAFPLISLLFGDLTDAFGQNSADPSALLVAVTDVSIKFVYLAIGAGVAGYIEMACWMTTGERQAARVRRRYLAAVLRQDMAYFDRRLSTGEVIGHMSGDIVLVQDAMGEKGGKGEGRGEIARTGGMGMGWEEGARTGQGGGGARAVAGRGSCTHSGSGEEVTAGGQREEGGRMMPCGRREGGCGPGELVPALHGAAGQERHHVITFLPAPSKTPSLSAPFFRPPPLPVGSFLRYMAQFAGGFIIAFLAGWQLALLMLATLPLLAGAGAMMALMISISSSKGQIAYGAAGVIVEECVSAIRTVPSGPINYELDQAPSALGKPLRAGAGAMMALMISISSSKGQLAYGAAGVIVEECVSAILTVAAFTGEHRAVQQYSLKLNRAFREGVKQSVAAGAGLGVTVFIMFSSYALALWYGSKMIADAGYTGGDVFTVAPEVTAFASGQAAAGKIFEVLERQPPIDSSSEEGERPAACEGALELREVTFAYPSRPDVPIFQSFSLEVPAGRTMALVGESGSGKSTVVALVERFYDPQSGAVLLDGRSIAALNLRWLRQHMGLVSQEPALFGTSIRQNIAYGKDGATDEEIREAARLANIHHFIESLPNVRAPSLQPIIALYLPPFHPICTLFRLCGVWLCSVLASAAIYPSSNLLPSALCFTVPSSGLRDAGGGEGLPCPSWALAYNPNPCPPSTPPITQGYETQVGERGTQLSGGQKQRVAIARAILPNPRVLLLDEATSALDAESEQAVQAALDALMGARTTLVVAHRLSTVRRAHCIAVLQRGQVVQTGTHAALLAQPQGAYAQLVRLQQLAGEGGGEEGKGEVGGGVEGGEKGGLSLIHAGADAKGVSVPQEAASTGEAGVEGVLAGAVGVATTGDGGTKGTEGGRKGGKGGKTGNGEVHKGSEAKEEAGAEEKEEDEEEKKEKKHTSIIRLATLNKPEWPYALVGTIFAACYGFIIPFFALILSNIITTFYNPDISQMRSDADFWASLFVVLGASACVTSFFQYMFFGVVGNALIRRVRVMCFATVLRQEIGWFDMEENSSGAIGARLATDAAQVRNMVGDQLALIVQNTATLCTGLVIAFRANWQLSLLVLALIPLLAIAGTMQIRAIQGFADDAKEQFQEASRVANDAVGAMRTVAAFGAEQRVQELYNERCSTPIRAGIRKAHVSGAGLAFGQFAIFAVYALSFWLGGKLVEWGYATFTDVFQVFFAIAMSAMSVAKQSALAPDMATVQTAVNSIFRILDRQSKIDPEAGGEEPEEVLGEVQFHAVCFAYPARPSVVVLQDFNLVVTAGQTVALVGESGSGKSTVVALVERFYDPQSGAVLLDGRSIAALNLRWLRQHMGLVSQEPALFNISIRDNIAYGRAGSGGASGGEISEAEIVEAARAANVHGFISGLPQGYATLVGERGVQISGGQKQRIAIARAIIGDPCLLLLDEATSALDAESEKVVQTALEKTLHVGVQPLQGVASSFLSTGAAKLHAQATKPPIQVAAKLPTPPPMPKSIYATTKAASVKKPPPSKAPAKTPTKTPAPVLKKNPPIPVAKLTAAPPAKPPAKPPVKPPAKPPARPPQVPPPKSPVKPVVKPPPAPLRLTPIAAVQQPPWPYSSMKNIPPDVPPPPYPPAPPARDSLPFLSKTRPLLPSACPFSRAVRVPNVGVITNIMDVCRVCSALPYDGACYSDYVSTCVAAMNQLRRNVWKVPDQVCDCYSAIASQMIRICPGIDRRVAYCFYGARCTFVPTLYALLTPQHVVTTGNSTAAPSGRGVAVLDLQPNMTAMAGVNFLIQLSSAPAAASSSSTSSSSTAPTAPLQITGASVYNSIMGSEGPLTLPLLAAQANQTMGSDGTGRVDTALGLLQRMTLEPYSFYIQVDTPAGSLRGQLVFSPHLFSLATSRNVPTSCASGDCMAIVDLDISPTNIVYSFAYSSGVAGIIGASVIQGVAGSSGARLFDFFWPGANAPSFTNGVTPPVTAIQSLLTAPQAHYIYFTTQLMPFGALRGQFQDTMYVTAVMYGASVVNFPGTTATQGQGSGAPGMGFFDAVLGGGGICYTFRFSSSVKTDCNYAYLHQGELNKRGPIYLYQTLRIIPGQQLCVPADPDITAAMALRPQRFYVQAYSLQFPYGAFRGQLHPDKQSSGLAVS